MTGMAGESLYSRQENLWEELAIERQGGDEDIITIDLLKFAHEHDAMTSLMAL